MQQLRERWQALMERVGGSPAAEGIFAVIVDSYSGYGRYYHNLNHLANGFAELAAVAGELADREAVEFALWFHDIVYVPGNKYNEVISAAIAYTYALELTGCTVFAGKVRRLVEATQHDADAGLDADTQFLLDADLAILGYPWPQFAAYSDGIRREFFFLSDNAYRAGRRAVLQKFLNRPYIYHTEFFRAKYENCARANIARLLADITSLSPFFRGEGE